METDDAIDDLRADLDGGGRLFIQAKHSLRLSTSKGTALVKAIAQCRAAVERDDIQPERDRLAIATAAPSKNIRALAKALTRRRDRLAGAPTKIEAEALSKLEELLEGLSDAQREKLLDSLVIWPCDAATEDGPDARLGGLLLDGAIVAEGEGAKAFEALRAKIRALAITRGGIDRSGLLRVLEESKCSVRGPGPLLARQAAIGAYRQRLRRRGETIRMLGVGAGLPDLELPDLDAEVRVSEGSPESELGSEHPLGLLLRRRGRVLLTGLPGSGKSTALKQAAAEQASDPEAPLPIFVDLSLLAPRLRSESAFDAILVMVCGEAPYEDREPLRAELADAIDAAEATFYLDSLDETRGRKGKVVESIAQLLGDRGPGLEAVLATRDSAVESAHALGFNEARLQPPRKMMTTVNAVLRAFAKRDDHGESWVTARAGWVREVLDRDSELSQTPLMPILLAVSAAGRSKADELPTRRAEILQRVVRDVVDEWEAGRDAAGQPRLGGLVGPRAAEALFDCFVCEGSLLAGESLVSEETVVDALADRLRKGWGLSPADARGTGREAVSFWDEAGFFLRINDGNLEARVRLFAEVADAIRQVDGEPERLDGWIERTSGDADRVESLKLAAGLSPMAAKKLVEVSVAKGSLDSLRVVVDAITEGALVDEPHLIALCDSLDAIVRAGGENLVDAAGLLADLPVPESRRRALLATFRAHLSAEQNLIAQIRARIKWKLAGGKETHALLQAILETDSPRPNAEVDEEGIILSFPGVDQRWGEAVLMAARELVPVSEDAALRAADLMNKVSGRDSALLAEILGDAGYDTLVARELKNFTGASRSMRGWQERLRRSREAETVILEEIAGLAVPAKLSLRERRGLDELADFFFTLGIPDSAAGESEGLALNVPEAMRLLVDAVARLGDFNIPVLAGEAALAREEIGDEDLSPTSTLLMMPGKERPLAAWANVDEPEVLKDRLIRLLFSMRFSAVVAAGALLRAPADLSVEAPLQAALSRAEGWRRRLAGAVILDRMETGDGLSTASEWLEGADSFLGRAATLTAVARFDEGVQDAQPLVERALADPDAQIRDEALVRLRGSSIDARLASLITRAAKQPSTWICDNCGVENPGRIRACASCRRVGPELSSNAKELVGIDV